MALHGLGWFAGSNTDAADALNQALASGTNPEARRTAIQAVQVFRLKDDPRFVKALGAALDDQDPLIVSTALGAIQNLGPEIMAKYHTRIQEIAETSKNPYVVQSARSVLTVEAQHE